MNAKYFLDTNILVYSFDHAAPDKQKKAVRLIDDAMEHDAGLISSQVVQEFLNVAIKKFAVKLNRRDIHMYLEDVLLPLCAVYPTAASYTRALNMSEETGFSFYDAMILVAAGEAGCRVVYSEDMQHARCIDGVRIIDPFNPHFSIERGNAGCLVPAVEGRETRAFP